MVWGREGPVAQVCTGPVSRRRKRPNFGLLLTPILALFLLHLNLWISRQLSDMLLVRRGPALLVEDIPCEGTVIRLAWPDLSGARQGLWG